MTSRRRRLLLLSVGSIQPPGSAGRARSRLQGATTTRSGLAAASEPYTLARVRQDHLERLGWRFHRIWPMEWFHHRERAVARALTAYDQALGEPRPNAARRPAHARHDDLASDKQGSDAVGQTTRGPRPAVGHGGSIDEYSHRQLVELIRWFTSDGRLRTQEELIPRMPGGDLQWGVRSPQHVTDDTGIRLESRGIPIRRVESLISLSLLDSPLEHLVGSHQWTDVRVIKPPQTKCADEAEGSGDGLDWDGLGPRFQSFRRTSRSFRVPTCL